jgi:hypothetical protein
VLTNTSDSGYDTDVRFSLITTFQPATDTSQSISASQLSLSSSVFEFVHEHGHRYHRKAALLPNDEAEQDRLDL